MVISCVPISSIDRYEQNWIEKSEWILQVCNKFYLDLREREKIRKVLKLRT